MTKDCGCNKKEKKEKKEEKSAQKQIWVYKKTCDNKKLNIPDNSYLGKIGFTYYLVDNDKKENTEYKVNFKFSNFNSGEIVYYVNLYKVTKTKIDKKTNTISKYLECSSKYSYTSKLDQNKITNIINEIGNEKYDLTPHNSNEFNSKVIENILKTNGKKGTSRYSVKLGYAGKGYGDVNCGGECDINGQSCVNSCFCNITAYPVPICQSL